MYVSIAMYPTFHAPGIKITISIDHPQARIQYSCAMYAAGEEHNVFTLTVNFFNTMFSL